MNKNKKYINCVLLAHGKEIISPKTIDYFRADIIQCRRCKAKLKNRFGTIQTCLCNLDNINHINDSKNAIFYSN